MDTIELKVKSCTLILSSATDKIVLNVELPTAFPEMKYDCSFSTDARHGYGEQWCKEVLGLTPNIINTRHNQI